MLNQPLYSLFIRLIPEAFIIIYSIYRLTNTKINLKKLIISSILGGIGVYIARLLPIHFGVHTIIAIMMYVFLTVKFNNIDIHKSISTVLLAHVFLFISDFILVIVYTKILRLSSDVILGQTWIANVAGIPSLVIFYLIITLILYFKSKRVNYE
ncbi:MAG: hypothetical protein K0Q97_1128 [Bacillota bacterium]|nr:hypothetical protein [Bacillota bacterium]